VQFGLMYVLYLRAFALLQAYEVALFTIFTPVYIALLDAAVEHRWQPGICRGRPRARRRRHPALALHPQLRRRRRLHPRAVLQPLLRRRPAGLQAPARPAGRHQADAEIFALPYAGALVATAGRLALHDRLDRLPAHAPAGRRHRLPRRRRLRPRFFWWNLGATRVNTGTLAVFNNAKIPLGVAVSLLFFGETANLPRLLLSAALMLAAIAVAENWFRKSTPIP
jgi:hypothetical protein